MANVEALAAQVARLQDLEDIKTMKYRYFRAMTFGDHDALKETLTADVVTSYSDGAYVFDDREALLRFLIDSFDHKRCYRDAPIIFHGLHPVRQGFRLMWRFARIAPFPDFNAVIAWLGLNAWLQSRGFPLLCAERGDQEFLTRLLSGPPPTKIVQFEARLLAAFEVLHGRDAG